MSNKPYDESLNVEDAEEIFTPRHQDSIDHDDQDHDHDDMNLDDHNLDQDEDEEEQEEEDQISNKDLGESQQSIEQLNEEDTMNQLQQLNSKRFQGQSPGQINTKLGEETDEDEEQDDEVGSGESDIDHNQDLTENEGVYDPSQFDHLSITPEIREICSYIIAYHPQIVELDTSLRPFLPDYVPAVGDIDAFIKIHRPDDLEDNLGLSTLDEPSANQSDPTVLDLQMRSLTKEGAPKGTVLKRVERADKNTKEVETWIKNIASLHRSKPATLVPYTKPMPDIDFLMQEWPGDVEDLLKLAQLPTAESQMTLDEYADIILTVLDIPVYKTKRLHSLHVLFTLYSEFKNSQHFKVLADNNEMDNTFKQQQRFDGGKDNTDQLIL